MKRMFILAAFLCFQFLPCGYAVEPISDLKAFCSLKPEDTICKWTANVGDTGNVVFLSTKQDYKDARHDGQMPTWTVYLPVINSTEYVKLSGLKDPRGTADVSDVPVHPDRMYSGQITQLRTKGIVTAQIDRPRKGAPVGYMYAYTLEGTYMRQTLLERFDPDNLSELYNQYLSEKKRTHVQLEEINP